MKWYNKSILLHEHRATPAHTSHLNESININGEKKSALGVNDGPPIRDY